LEGLGFGASGAVGTPGLFPGEGKLGVSDAPVLAKPLPVLQWTDSDTDLVELIYGVHLSASFNHGKATLKQTVHWFEAHLNIDLGHYHVTFQEIARRKNSRTKYTDRMRERLNKKMDAD
jgi:hypothetical protein